MLSLRPVTTADEIATAQLLLREYAIYLNHSLGEEHICLDSYDRELVTLPGPYAAPRGAILLAFYDEEPAGCVALKPLKPERALESEELACEMKRLWVRPAFRGQNIGLALTQELIVYALRQSYTSMYLDTVPEAMRSASHIYRKLGFQPVERYNLNPILGTTPAMSVEFFRLQLGGIALK